MTENAKREGPRMRQTLQGLAIDRLTYALWDLYGIEGERPSVQTLDSYRHDAISLLEALLGLHEGEDEDDE